MADRRKQAPPAAAAPPAPRIEPDLPEQPLILAPGPSIRPLTPQECRAVLARNSVARVAYAFERQVDILPIHYVYDDDWLYGRTSEGAKLAKWRHSRWIAVEVDEIRGLFDWVSVVVRGSVYTLDPEGSEAEGEVWERAIMLLRRLVPETGTVHDPVPHRTVLFRIHVDELTGREAHPGPPPA